MRPCRDAAVRRASRQAHRDRGAHRRRKPRRRLDCLRHEGHAAWVAARRAVHVCRLRAVRPLRQYRARGQHRAHLRRPLSDRLDPDAARHRRHRAHHGHCGRRQRAHQRAHPRGNTLGQIAGRLYRGRLSAGHDHDHRFQHDHADLDAVAVLAWLWCGARICRDPHHRHSRLNVHRRDPDAAHGVLLAALGAARPDPDLGNAVMFTGIHFIPADTKIGFVRLRTISWVISALLTILPLLLVWKVGLNFGIDFQGGTLIEIQTKESVADLADIRAKVHGLNLGEVQIQEFGAPNDVLIRVAAQPTEKEQQESIAKVKQVIGDQVEYRRIEVVGPTISSELIAGGTVAVVVAMIAILMYIWFRFEWQFAVAAIASLVHDVTGTIGLYSLLQLEFNLSSIAAILTIIGYSLNDRVVIFDRIRENLRKYKKMPLTELLDLSINETLSRTVLTHVTTFLAMMPFVLVGGEAIFGFALAMVWGIVIGAYSSIYVAAPLQLILGVKRDGGMASTSARAKTQARARA